MKQLSKFNIILAAVAFVLIIAGALLMDRPRTGYYLLYPGLLLAAIFSITSVIDVFKATEMSPGRRIIWIILSISVPVFGGLLFYLIHHGKSKQTTGA